MTYDELPHAVIDFLSYLETIKGRSPDTVKEYFYDLRLLFRFLVKRNSSNQETRLDQVDISQVDTTFIQAITLSDLYAFMAYCAHDRNLAPRARARKVACFRAFFNFLQNKAGIITMNPAASLESPTIARNLPVYLDVDESTALLDAIDGKHQARDLAILMLFLNCGLRLSELVSLNLGSIKNEYVTVMGKGSIERSIFINSVAMQCLQEYLVVRENMVTGDVQALFVSNRKVRISKKTVWHLVKKFVKKAGLDPDRISTHKLRHTAATLLYQYGKVDVRALQQILGHKSISTTEIYTHTSSTQLEEALSKNPLNAHWRSRR